MTEIVLVGIGANYAIPGVYVQLNFAQGPVSGSGSPIACLVLASKTSEGSAVNDTTVYGPDTPVTCQTEADAIALFGTGSRAHRAYLRFTAVNTISSLYFIAVTSSTGDAATLTETITGTATGIATHTTYCEDMSIQTTINPGDTPTAIAANIVDSVNSQTRWPVTASSAAGVVTYTARETGVEGNWIRMQASITPGAATVTATTSLTANTNMSGGTIAENNTEALATIASSQFYYIVSCQSDETNVARLTAQVLAQAEPLGSGKQRIVFGSTDTLANTITTAITINSPRDECEWANALDVTPSEIAAGQCALFMQLEQGLPVGVNRKNFSNFPATVNDSPYWQWVAGRNGVGGSPTQIQINSALNNGISPLVVAPVGSGPVSSGGAAQFVKRCTTYSLNGTVSDYRIRDAHRVSVCDYWCNYASAMTSETFGGKDLLPNVAQGQPPPPPQATTPSLWANELKRTVDDFGNAGQWTYPPGVPVLPGQSPADVINGQMVVQAETNPPNRLSALVGLAPVNLAEQFNILAQQVA